MNDDTHPPLVISDSGDILFFATLTDAQQYLEPADCDAYEAFDASGHRLELRTQPAATSSQRQSQPRQLVSITMARPESIEKEHLMELLVAYAHQVGVAVTGTMSVEQLVSLIVAHVGMTR